MPCKDEMAEFYENEQRIKKINDLTRMLCEACKCIEGHGKYLPTEEIGSWWKNHKAEDAQRRVQELRNEAYRTINNMNEEELTNFRKIISFENIGRQNEV